MKDEKVAVSLEILLGTQEDDVIQEFFDPEQQKSCNDCFQWNFVRFHDCFESIKNARKSDGDSP